MKRRSFLAGGLALAGGAWVAFESDEGSDSTQNILIAVYQSNAETGILGLWTRDLGKIHIHVPTRLWDVEPEVIGRTGLLIQDSISTAFGEVRDDPDGDRAPVTISGVEGEDESEGEQVTLVLDGSSNLVLIESVLVADRSFSGDG